MLYPTNLQDLQGYLDSLSLEEVRGVSGAKVWAGAHEHELSMSCLVPQLHNGSHMQAFPFLRLIPHSFGLYTTKLFAANQLSGRSILVVVQGAESGKSRVQRILRPCVSKLSWHVYKRHMNLVWQVKCICSYRLPSHIQKSQRSQQVWRNELQTKVTYISRRYPRNDVNATAWLEA